MIPGNAISISRPFSSMAALLLFAGSGPAASLRLAYMDVGKGGREQGGGSFALNENGRTLNTAFPSIMGKDVLSV